MDYKFYVFTNNGTKKDLTLKDAIKKYKKTETGAEYKALGVTKGDMYSCDLVNNKGENNRDKISLDYTKMEEFKDDSLIKINTVKILEKEFGL